MAEEKEKEIASEKASQEMIETEEIQNADEESYLIDADEFLSYKVFHDSCNLIEAKLVLRNIAIKLLSGTDEEVEILGFKDLNQARLNGEHLVRRLNEIQDLSDLNSNSQDLKKNKDFYESLDKKIVSNEASNGGMALTNEERVQLSHALHNQSKALVNKKNQGLSFVALGTILAIIGLVFIPLSFKKVRNQFEGMDFSSLAFIIFVIALSIGVIMIIGGIILAIRSDKKRREVNSKLSIINND